MSKGVIGRKCTKKFWSEPKKRRQRIRTTRNKLKRINKQLKTAGGKEVQNLKEIRDHYLRSLSG